MAEICENPTNNVITIETGKDGVEVSLPPVFGLLPAAEKTVDSCDRLADAVVMLGQIPDQEAREFLENKWWGFIKSRIDDVLKDSDVMAITIEAILVPGGEEPGQAELHPGDADETDEESWAEEAAEAAANGETASEENPRLEAIKENINDSFNTRIAAQQKEIDAEQKEIDEHKRQLKEYEEERDALINTVELQENRSDLGPDETGTPPSKQSQHKKDQRKGAGGKPKPRGRRKGSSKGTRIVVDPEAVTKEVRLYPPGMGPDTPGYDWRVGSTHYTADMKVTVSVVAYEKMVGTPEGGGETVAGKFPREAWSEFSYGPRLSASLVAMVVENAVAYERIARTQGNLLGFPLTGQTVNNMVRRAAATVEPVVEEVIGRVASARVKYADETGLAVGGRTGWVHTATDGKVAYYNFSWSRGIDGIIEGGCLTLPENNGSVVVRDRFGSYDKLAAVLAGEGVIIILTICIQHLLRDCKRVFKLEGADVALEARDKLKEMVSVARACKAAGLDKVPACRRRRLRRELKAILKRGLRESKVKAVYKSRVHNKLASKLASRLKARMDESLEALRDPEAKPLWRGYKLSGRKNPEGIDNLAEVCLEMESEARIAAKQGRPVDEVKMKRLEDEYAALLDRLASARGTDADGKVRYLSPKEVVEERTELNILFSDMLERLDQICYFMSDLRVEPTNNIAERALRMIKVKIKVSGCYRKDDGARDFARLKTFFSAAKASGLDPAFALYQANIGNPDYALTGEAKKGTAPRPVVWTEPYSKDDDPDSPAPRD